MGQCIITRRGGGSKYGKTVWVRAHCVVTSKWEDWGSTYIKDWCYGDLSNLRYYAGNSHSSPFYAFKLVSGVDEQYVQTDRYEPRKIAYIGDATITPVRGSDGYAIVSHVKTFSITVDEAVFYMPDNENGEQYTVGDYVFHPAMDTDGYLLRPN